MPETVSGIAGAPATQRRIHMYVEAVAGLLRVGYRAQTVHEHDLAEVIFMGLVFLLFEPAWGGLLRLCLETRDPDGWGS